MIPAAAPCRLTLPGNSSGEIAADRVLHVQRLTLPLGRNTAAKPRLGRRPPPATVLTSEPHPPPALDDMAKRPQVPGRPGHVHRLVQVLLEPGPVDIRQGDTDLHDPLGQLRTDGRLGTAHTMVPCLQTSVPLRSVTEPARASLHARPRRRSAPPSSRDCFLPNATASYRSRWALQVRRPMAPLGPIGSMRQPSSSKVDLARSRCPVRSRPSRERSPAAKWRPSSAWAWASSQGMASRSASEM